MHLEWDDASCDVVANRGRCRRWSPPRGYDFSKMCLLACVYARAHQRFRTFCFHNLHTLPLFCQRLSIETRELRQKTLGRFFFYFPTFFFFTLILFKIASAFTKNLLFGAVPALAAFLAFCLLFFYIFSPRSMKLQKNVYKEGIITFVSVACTTICEGCESKKCYFAGCARVRARERP